MNPNPATIDFIRCNKPFLTFRQDDVTKKFFSVARELGFRVVVTGNCVYTHEFSGTREEFDIINELSKLP